MNTLPAIFFAPILAIYILFGVWFYFFPPKKINHFIGYRTGLSMKNQESWDYSQKRFGKLALYIGFAFLLIFFALYYLKMLNTISFMLFLTLSILGFLFIIVTIQKDLKGKYSIN